MKRLENSSQVKQFLDLQKKELRELQDLCEGLKLSPDGEREALIERLLEASSEPQSSIFQPQAIPLRTRTSKGTITQAPETFKRWRRLIFEAKGNTREFSLLNNNGKPYTINLKYIRCPSKVLEQIIQRGWILPLEAHREILHAAKTSPERFEANIIQKPDRNGKGWLMLHLELKEAA